MFLIILHTIMIAISYELASDEYGTVGIQPENCIQPENVIRIALDSCFDIGNNSHTSRF